MLRSHQPSETLGAHGDGLAHALEQRRQLARIQLAAPIRVDLSELRFEHKGLGELVAVDRPAAVRVLSHTHRELRSMPRLNQLVNTCQLQLVLWLRQ